MNWIFCKTQYTKHDELQHKRQLEGARLCNFFSFKSLKLERNQTF